MKKNQGQNKILVFFKEFLRKNKFIDFVKNVRTEFEIPVSGFILSKENLTDLDINGLRHFPVELKNNGEFDEYIFSMYLDERLKDISYDEFFNKSEALVHALKLYIFYNQVPQEEFAKLEDRFSILNLCKLVDNFEEINSFETNSENKVESYVRSLIKENEKFPVSIRIHPNASQRDVVDFVTKNWSLIQKIQKEHKKQSSIGKYRKRINMDRYGIVYENRHKTIKEINDILKKYKYGAIAYAEKNKIVSLEEQRRKQV